MILCVMFKALNQLLRLQKQMALAGPGMDTTRDEYGNTVLLNGV
jgi:hypothetical protein